MKAEFLAGNLEQFIPLLTKILSSHSPLPVLSNFLIVADTQGLHISATDLEMGVTVKVPAKVDEEGGITIPGRQFAEIISSFSQQNIKLSQEKESLVVSSLNTVISFQTISREEFPSLFVEKGDRIYSFKMDEFKSIFSKLTFVVSTDDSRPALTGIYLKQRKDGVDFVATDGFRMSLKHVKGIKIFSEEEGLIISAKLINEVLALKESGEVIDMYYYPEGNQVLFETERVTIVGRSIEGQFPNYERVIPVSHATKVLIDTEELSQLIRVASVLARDSANVVKFKIEGNVLSIHARSSSVGEGDVKMDVAKDGENNEISFNAKYVIDVLRNIHAKNITMQLTKFDEPSLFTTDEDTQFTHVIMPIRVQE